MTVQEITEAVDAGQVVHWSNENYTVIKDKLGRYLIQCTLNNSCIGLTTKSGKLNGNTSEFYIAYS